MIDDNTIFEAGGGLVATVLTIWNGMITGSVRDAKKEAVAAKQAVIDLEIETKEAVFGLEREVKQKVANLEISTNEKISALTGLLKDSQTWIARVMPTKEEMNAAILETKDSVKRINDRMDEILRKIT